MMIGIAVGREHALNRLCKLIVPELYGSVVVLGVAQLHLGVVGIFEILLETLGVRLRYITRQDKGVIRCTYIIKRRVPLSLHHIVVFKELEL
jgi:hypothetical protein